MPIMIRNNDATELCITKGQEAYVVGWDAIDGPDGQKVLETLFLELKNPPKTIELPDLPKNVIPMTRTSKKIKSSLPNDYEVNIIRQQINVLPNFSMTDYASQGKTRPDNPVNLSHCRNFQSIYTCLSRSSNAAGTLIIQGFNSSKITKGLPGHLRQEFWELHLLNNITKEIYEGHLNKKFIGPLRNPMLYRYQTEMKKNYSNDLHRALKPSDGELIFKERGQDGIWDLNVYRDLTNSNKREKGLKRKLSALHSIEKNSDFEKKPKINKLFPSIFQNLNIQSPIGLIWDENDYSCAYDSLFTVLYHIWNEGQLSHRSYFENGMQLTQILHSHFISLLNKTSSFESVRDQLRAILNHKNPLQYHYGKVYTDIDQLVRDFISTKSYGISHLECLNCKFSINKQFTYLQGYTAVGWSSADQISLQTASVQRFLNYKIFKINERTNYFCPNCRKFKNKELSLYNTQYVNELPAVLIFALAPWIDISQCLTFDVSNGSKTYVLKGIIYSNNHHFTARLIDNNLSVWYHDGQATRSLCQREQNLTQNEDIVHLKTFGQYKAIVAFYSEK